jgi:hypothetical protein
MVDYVVTGGQAGGYAGGVQVVGTAPALITAPCTVTARNGRNIVNGTPPNDPNWAATLLFRFTRTTPGVQVAFNGAASPYMNIGRLAHFKDAILTTDANEYDYYFVTIDKYGYPLTKTSANATYAGGQ